MTRLKKILAALPTLVVFLLISAAILEVACIYGIVRAGIGGATGDVSIYLLIILVLGALIALGLTVGNYLVKP
ncbi:MAG: hypothetical protein AAF632_25265 [Bacteroidota bacterium]